MGGSFADPLEIVQGERNSGLVGDGQQVQDEVGGSAHRGGHGDGVLESLPGHHIPGPDAGFQNTDDGPAGLIGQLLPGPAGGDRRGSIGKRQPHRLEGGGHGVGGEHPPAGAVGGHSGFLQLLELLHGHPTAAHRPHRLEDILDGHSPPAPVPRGNASSIQVDRGQVQAGHGHHAGGLRLIAPPNGHQGIQLIRHGGELDGIGDQLPADQGGFHALMSHPDSVVGRDGVELDGRPARIPDPLFDELSQMMEMMVAGLGFEPGVGDADERSAEVLIPESDSPQHGPVRSSLQALRHPRTAMLAPIRGDRHGGTSGSELDRRCTAVSS
ncbi:hypothetical protein HRbin22_01447 [Candidatus Thermoflexus japonica]|uniref:Uncharacterized protein n=1 Tax=Candidatus Thermoflexus japonica TaxID=2035417 RepID=A0A2H5Y747_9CHLR|nr:hypothetical protein HRbin22_01447 [Candidatus Thermoflexus japonica]